jgi:hypothetical protein
MMYFLSKKKKKRKKEMMYLFSFPVEETSDPLKAMLLIEKFLDIIFIFQFNYYLI